MKTRRRSGALLLSEDNKLFLFKFEFAFLDHGKILWVTPGGGVHEGESFEQGLQRELYEELGLNFTISKPYSFFRKMPLTHKSGEGFISDERYFVVKVPEKNVTFDNMSSVERELTKEGKWWSADDIRLSNEEFFVENLTSILEDIIGDNLSLSPQEI